LILPDGVILDETILNQVRLHHVIFLGKLVLAAIERTKGELLTQTQMMLLHSGNKLSHMTQERQIGAQPRCLVHPFPVHDRDLAHAARKSHKQSSIRKMLQSSSRSSFLSPPFGSRSRFREKAPKS
jgi:hypothetical protein